MPIRVTTSNIRPHPYQDWYKFTDEQAHTLNEPDRTGARISMVKTVSADGLTQTNVSEWRSHAERDEFFARPDIQAINELREVYNRDAGITKTEAVIEEI